MIHILSQLATRETLAPGRTQIEDNVAKPFYICMPHIISTIRTIGINCKKQYNGHTSYIFIYTSHVYWYTYWITREFDLGLETGSANVYTYTLYVYFQRIYLYSYCYHRAKRCTVCRYFLNIDLKPNTMLRCVYLLVYYF